MLVVSVPLGKSSQNDDVRIVAAFNQQCCVSGLHHASCALDKPVSELRSAQNGIHFQCQTGERLRPLPMLLRNMQVAAHFESDCDLGRHSLSTANVLLQDLALIKAVQHAKHA